VKTHVGQEKRACRAATLPSAVVGCWCTADCSPTLLKVSGAMRRHVSQSMQVWSTKKEPSTFSLRGSLLLACREGQSQWAG
jgi:hypothetical protein